MKVDEIDELKQQMLCLAAKHDLWCNNWVAPCVYFCQRTTFKHL